MKEIIYKSGLVYDRESIENLYLDAGWYAYTKDIDKLMKAIGNSLKVITAWEEDKLVGLIRVVGDGLTIVYIQDLLVIKSHKRRGIGSKLFKHILDEYKYVRQKVLLTDNNEETKGFYEANGFKSNDTLNLVSYVKLD